MQMDDPDRDLFLFCFENKQRSNFMLFHTLQRFRCQIGPQNPFWLATYDLTNWFVQHLDALFDRTPQITVGKHADQPAPFIDNPGNAQLLAGNFVEGILERRVQVDRRNISPDMHQIFNPHQEAFAEGATGMIEGEILFTKTSLQE